MSTYKLLTGRVIRINIFIIKFFIDCHQTDKLDRIEFRMTKKEIYVR
jgi:hypothetical protein